MSDLAIQTSDLGKLYHIGVQKTTKTMRQVLNDTLTSRFRRETPVLPPYEDLWALRHLSFELKHGDSLGIVGRNGAGKSTLLKMLTRIMRPTEGSLRISGRVGSLLEVGIGFHPELSGRENIYLNGSIMGVKRSEIERKFDEIVDFSGIERFIDTPVKYYSSGMYIRLAFAASVQFEPDILIIDEILAVGDVDFQRKCMAKLGQFRSQGQTTVLVSHNLSQMGPMCSTVLWIDGGQFVELGEPQTVIDHYLASFQEDAAPAAAIEPPSVEEVPSIPDAPVVVQQPNVTASVAIPVTTPVTISRLYLLDAQSQETTHIPRAQGFSLGVEYEVRQPVSDLCLQLNLLNGNDEVIFQLATQDNGVTQSHVAQETLSRVGVHQASVRIPGARFTSGYIRVEAIFASQTGSAIATSNDFTFEIEAPSVACLEGQIPSSLLEWNVS